jgi:cellulose biosynthesis protein BcsQ
MKTFELILQEKGGAGKSMLTYLQALKYEDNEEVYFVDLDSSTKTSQRQLAFLKDKERIFESSIMDHNKKIDREKIFTVFQDIATLPGTLFICDFGAPESQQVPILFSMDFTPEDLAELGKELKAKFVFKIVIAGGPAYQASMNYADELIDALDGKFDVLLLLNDYTFQNFEGLKEDVENYVASKNARKSLVSSVIRFGNIQMDRNSGSTIMDNMKEGKGISGIKAFAARLILKKEIARV